MLNKRLIEIFVLSVSGILFLSMAFVGVFSGRREAASFRNLTNAKELALGLKYFYRDQARFPTEQEYSDSKVMLGYFSTFPIPSVKTKNCNNDFVYRNTGLRNFELEYCLETGVLGELAGINKVTSTDEDFK